MKLHNIFTQEHLDHVCEINLDHEIISETNGPLRYIKIKNFLKNPEDLKDFLSSFPALDRFGSIKKNRKYLEDYLVGSKAPGIQQVIPPFYLRKLQKYLHETLNKLNFCRYSYDPDLWDFYTNYLDPNIESFAYNNVSHTDPFTYACNIYLTEVENSGTQFFKFKGLEKDFYEVNSLLKNQKEYEYFNSIKLYGDENDFVNGQFDEWNGFNGNEYLEQYHFIPAEYNSVSIYKGCFWHSIKYDSKNSTNTRYSLVGAIK